MNEPMEPLSLVRRDQQRAKIIRHFYPVGTPEDLRRHGLDPAEYGSCAPKEPKEGVLGCPAYHDCPLAKSGVQRFGVRTIKSPAKGGTMRICDMECYTAVTLANQAERDGNGDIVEVIAREGDTIRVPESVAVKDSLGRITHYDTGVVDRKVEPYPRIGDNPALMADALAGAERLRHQQEREAEHRDRSVAVGEATLTLTTGAPPQEPHRKPDRK